jgi:hypothetical protein
LLELAQFVGRKITYESDTHETINVGSIPVDIVDAYTHSIIKIYEKDEDIKKLEESSRKAFEKFKTCRS